MDGLLLILLVLVLYGLGVAIIGLPGLGAFSPPWLLSFMVFLIII